MPGDRLPPGAGPTEILPRIATLDGLRGIAILMVLFHNLDVLDSPSSRAAEIFDMLLDRGWIGVQLFFVLSGFLITSILLRTKTAANYFQVFYARRMLRIFPLYYLTLLVFLWLLPMLSDSVHDAGAPGAGGHQLWLWLFLSNWADPVAATSNLFPHFWSLAVEEQFYLVWPLLVLVLQPKQLLWTCVALAVAAPVVRSAMIWANSSHEAIYMFTVCRMDALAIGGAVAVAAGSGLLGRLTPRYIVTLLLTVFALGIVFTKGFPRMTALGQTLGYTVLAVSCGLLLCYALAANRRSLAGKIMQSGFLRSFGKYSFGIYVLHAPIHQLIGRPLLLSIANPPVQSLLVSVSYTAVMTGLVYATAVVMYHLVELPFLRLKHLATPREPFPASAV